MKLKLKYAFLIVIIFLANYSLKADNEAFTAEAPSKVVMGKQFKLTYTFTNLDAKDFRIPEINDFEILMGPSTSTSSQTSFVNGKRSSMTQRIYTYILEPKKEGTYTVAGATATVKKAQMTSNPVTITVLPADKAAAASSGNTSQGVGNSQSISSETLFVRAIPSKTKVYEQEGITLTYKLYSKVDVAGVDNFKFPEFKGFLAQEIELPANQQWDMENYEGTNYRTVVLKQTVLYPQQSGVLEIESGKFDLIIRVRNTSQRSRSFFDDFFDTYEDVKKSVSTKPIKITVDPYPFGKPADFNPFSGSLKMTSKISAPEVKADEAVTLKLILTGNGNMKMLKTPDIKFPADFDVYDPKVSNNFKNTPGGVTGTKTIEYLVIPRYAGTFEIPSVSLSYFDLATKTYKTLQSEPYTLEVARSENSDGTVVSGNYTTKESVRKLGEDIRYIKVDNLNIKPKASLVYGEKWFAAVYIVPLLLFVILMVIYRKQAKANADLAMVRTRKASKVAVKRLKKAASYLKSGDKVHFYDEVLRALWGYTSDKLNIPLSQLNKENIDAQLTASHVGKEIRKEYMEILETCEFEQYAPAEGSQAMDDLYAKTIKVIDKMENTIKARAKKPVVTAVMMLLCLSMSLTAFGQEDGAIFQNEDPTATQTDTVAPLDTMLQQAAIAYSENRFETSAALYENIIAHYGTSYKLYYNLGNAYYKANEIAPAILNYERALLLKPEDKDVRFNLEMCQAYVVDKTESLGEFLLVRWYKHLRNMCESNTWAYISMACFWIFILSLFGFFFAKKRGFKKTSFSIGIITLFISVYTLLYAAQQYNDYVYPSQAIVFSPSVTVKSSPDKSGTELFLLHEGTKVHIKSVLGAWSEIELEDGNVGWMESKDIQII